MQWKSPSERTQLIILSPVLIPCAAFIIAAALPVFAIEWLYRRYGPPRLKWRHWFAWRPVKCEGFFYDQPNKWVWLETVERRGGIFDDCEYRIIGWGDEAEARVFYDH